MCRRPAVSGRLPTAAVSGFRAEYAAAPSTEQLQSDRRFAASTERSKSFFRRNVRQKPPEYQRRPDETEKVQSTSGSFIAAMLKGTQMVKTFVIPECFQEKAITSRFRSWSAHRLRPACRSAAASS
ncbi:MAG: hypothetical protein DBX90_04980 [Lentisphaerae bacterium]|nr:MAG: hypothetical protein DBX90_04980 [Lentisphaerota bacterium]